MLNNIYQTEKRPEQEDLVSIIIPTYNVQKYIDECISSVLNQTHRRLEIICVDDHSQDETVTHIEALKREDDRIRLLLNESTRGPAYARNRGLEAATGKYIYFLDSDDYILENAIESLSSLADEYETECIFFDSYLQLESNMLGNQKVEYDLVDIDKEVMTGQELFTIMMNNNVFSSSVWRQFWNRKFMQENNIKFDDRMSSCEDAPFTVHAILRGNHMMVVNKKFHVYRKHEGTLISDVTPMKTIALFQSYCQVLKELSIKDYDKSTRCSLEKRCQQLLATARRMYIRNRFLVAEIEFDDDFERHLFGYLIKGKDDNLLEIEQATIHRIMTHPKVLIYGDSRYAMDILYTMEKLGIEVFGFAVTDKRGRGDDVAGIKLMEIYEYKKYRKEVIVILGITDKKNKTDVIQTLNNYGFYDYIDLNDTKSW